jgi:hypothetical protein
MLPERNEERGIVTIGFWERKILKMVLSLSSIAFLSLKGLRFSNCSLRERFTEAET